MSNRKQRDQNRATAKLLKANLIFMDMVMTGIGVTKGGERIRPEDFTEHDWENDPNFLD